MTTRSKIIVVGAGLAGMTAALRLVEAGKEVCLLSSHPLGVARSVLLDDGVCVSRGSGDSVDRHIQDTLEYAEDLVSPLVIRQVCERAFGVVNVLQRLGVDFERTAEGFLSSASSPGSTCSRRLRSRWPLGQQVVRVLAQQVLAQNAAEKIQFYEGWEFLNIVQDRSGVCVGVVAQNKESMEIGAFKGDAVVLATGDMGEICSGSILSTGFNSGYAAGQAYLEGACLANLEFIDPLTSHVMGGLWVDRKWMTSITGLFACGDCCYQSFGARVLPGNRLLNLWISGDLAAENAVQYAASSQTQDDTNAEEIFTAVVHKEQDRQADILDMSGPENVYDISDEFKRLMEQELGRERHNAGIETSLAVIHELKEKLQRISVTDKGRCLNEEIFFVRAVTNRLELARGIAMSALHRNESRGFHLKTEYPERDDVNFLRTTKVKKGEDGPVVMYEELDGVVAAIDKFNVQRSA